MKTINYKGKGEHSVRELELIIEQQAEELYLLKSGQKQLPIHGVVKSLPTKEEIELRAEQALFGFEEKSRKFDDDYYTGYCDGAEWMITEKTK